MDSSSHYQLPASLNASFQKEIDTYNNKEASADVKTQSLETINTIVKDVLKAAPSSQSQEAAQKVMDELKRIEVQPKDHDLWNQIMGEIRKAAPAYKFFEQFYHLPAQGELLPTEIYSKAMGKFDAIKLLDKPNLSAEERFQIAIE